ncbi:MAG: hypothetical protein NVS3B18_15670 [Candidatus Dormibacteria bacterium]
MTLIAVATQAGASSDNVSPGADTVTSRRLVHAIRAARVRGMQVILKPYVDVSGGQWRGTIHPRSVARWFATYDRFILTYANLAEREHVNGLVIGTEMESLAGEADHWRALAAAARRRFGGWITYQANHDGLERISWWDAVDAISVSAYFPLSTNLDATLGDLEGGWQGPLARLRSLATRWQRPLLFGEVGYRTIRGNSSRPWDVELRGSFSVNAQLIAYRAALAVWEHEPAFRGFEWWFASPTRLRVAPGTDAAITAPTLRALGTAYAQPERRITSGRATSTSR